MRHRNRFLAALMLACMPLLAAAQVTAPAPAPAMAPAPATIDTIVVSGRVTGPGLWHVYKDDLHDLWIMGTLSPLPAGIEWDASEVRDLVGSAQEVLWAPGYGVNVKANLFQQAMLGIGYLRAQKNPEGATLEEVLSPALYARGSRAKAAYLPGNSKVERQRPIVAAQELFEAAVKRARLSRKPIIHPAIKDTIEAHGVRSNLPVVEVKLDNATAKAALAEIRGARLDDEACLAATIDAVEIDIPRMVANANAWARGDIAAIGFAAMQRREDACSDAMLDPAFSAKYGLPNIRASIAARWIGEAESALAGNALTVAFVPMENLIGPDSYVERLRAQGYTVIAPRSASGPAAAPSR